MTLLTLPLASPVPLSPGSAAACLVHFKHCVSSVPKLSISVVVDHPLVFLSTLPPPSWTYLPGVLYTRDSQMYSFRLDPFKQQHLHLDFTLLP